MNRPHNFSDEQLTAYLDGEGDAGLLQAISDALKSDDQLRSRVEHLIIPQDEMKIAFDGLLPSAPPFPGHVFEKTAVNQGWRSMLRPISAAAIVCFSLGWIAAHSLTSKGPADWQQSVATYHALYVNETLASVSQSPADARDELARVSAAIGTKIAPDVLNSSQNLMYKRAQVLGFQGRPLVQLAFLSKTGVPVALCIIKSLKAGDAPISSNALLGMKSASWSKGNYDYLLVGGTDATLINDEAEAFFAKL